MLVINNNNLDVDSKRNTSDIVFMDHRPAFNADNGAHNEARELAAR